MKVIIWFPTYKCNLECPYCAARCMPLDSDGKEHSASQWIDVFSNNPFSKALPMVISGREPSCYAGLTEVLHNLSFRYRFETNLEIHPEKWTTRKILKQSYFFKCTYHHPVSDTEKLASYFDKIRWLKDHGCKMQCNMTRHQYYVKGDFEKFKKIASSIGIENVHLGTMMYYFMLREYFPYTGYRKLCSRGKDSVTIAPNGTIYRCVGHAYWGIKPLGNVFNDGWSVVLDEPASCKLSCCQCGFGGQLIRYDEGLIKNCRKYDARRYLVPRKRIYEKFGVYV